MSIQYHCPICCQECRDERSAALSQDQGVVVPDEFNALVVAPAGVVPTRQALD